MTKGTSKWREVTTQCDLCVTGDGLVYLQSFCSKDLNRLLSQIRVFARFDPKQKEFVITSLRDAGFCVLMLQVILADPPFLCEATCVKIATEKVTVRQLFQHIPAIQAIVFQSKFSFYRLMH